MRIFGLRSKQLSLPDNLLGAIFRASDDLAAYAEADQLLIMKGLRVRDAYGQYNLVSDALLPLTLLHNRFPIVLFHNTTQVSLSLSPPLNFDLF